MFLEGQMQEGQRDEGQEGQPDIDSLEDIP
jgi:hypothetical protein